MKTALPDHVAAPYYKQLEETIKELFAGPQAELEDLIAKYGHLIDGTDEAQNEKYSGDNFTFEEAVEDIKKARFEIRSLIHELCNIFTKPVLPNFIPMNYKKLEFGNFDNTIGIEP